MEPLQIFYRNEQMKTPFDIVWDLRLLSHNRFFDGLYIIEHLSSFVVKWLVKYVNQHKKSTQNGKMKKMFTVQGNNIVDAGQDFLEEGKNLIFTIGQVIGISEKPVGCQGQHNDEDNEAIEKMGEFKNNELNELIMQDKDQHINVENRAKKLHQFVLNNLEKAPLTLSHREKEYQKVLNELPADKQWDDEKNHLDQEGKKYGEGLKKLYCTTIDNSEMAGPYKFSSLLIENNEMREKMVKILTQRKNTAFDTMSLEDMGKKKIELLDHNFIKTIPTFEYILHHLFFWLCYLEKHKDVFWLMETFGISPFLTTSYNDLTCMHMAAANGKLELLQILMTPLYTWKSKKTYCKCKIIMMYSKSRLYTPLHEATAKHQTHVVKWILEWFKETQGKLKHNHGTKPNKVSDKNAQDLVIVNKQSPYHF